MADDTTKVVVIEEIDLAVKKIGAQQGRKRDMDGTLSPSRKVRIPATKKISRSVSVEGRNVDSIHAAILDDVRVISKQMLASPITRKPRKTVSKWLEHARFKHDTLEMTEKVGTIELWELHRHSMIRNPAKLRARSNPGNDRARSDADGDRVRLLHTILEPFLIVESRMGSLQEILLMGNLVTRLIRIASTLMSKRVGRRRWRSIWRKKTARRRTSTIV
jgi:hypothetical protein